MAILALVVTQTAPAGRTRDLGSGAGLETPSLGFLGPVADDARTLYSEDPNPPRSPAQFAGFKHLRNSAAFTGAIPNTSLFCNALTGAHQIHFPSTLL